MKEKLRERIRWAILRVALFVAVFGVVGCGSLNVGDAARKVEDVLESPVVKPIMTAFIEAVLRGDIQLAVGDTKTDFMGEYVLIYAGKNDAGVYGEWRQYLELDDYLFTYDGANHKGGRWYWSNKRERWMWVHPKETWPSAWAMNPTEFVRILGTEEKVSGGDVTGSPASDGVKEIILCTDYAWDVDDVVGVELALALEAAGRCKILSIVCSDEDLNTRGISAHLTYYGRQDIPIGLGGKSIGGRNTPYVPTFIREMPHTVPNARAVDVMREALNRASGKVTLITIGYLGNARALAEADRGLVERRVDSLVSMAGTRPGGDAENNLRNNVSDASWISSNWPTPIKQVSLDGTWYLTGVDSQNQPGDSPMHIAFRAFNSWAGNPHSQGRGSPDPAAVWYGVMGASVNGERVFTEHGGVDLVWTDRTNVTGSGGRDLWTSIDSNRARDIIQRETERLIDGLSRQSFAATGEKSSDRETFSAWWLASLPNAVQFATPGEYGLTLKRGELSGSRNSRPRTKADGMEVRFFSAPWFGAGDSRNYYPDNLYADGVANDDYRFRRLKLNRELREEFLKIARQAYWEYGFWILLDWHGGGGPGSAEWAAETMAQLKREGIPCGFNANMREERECVEHATWVYREIYNPNATLSEVQDRVRGDRSLGARPLMEVQGANSDAGRIIQWCIDNEIPVIHTHPNDAKMPDGSPAHDHIPIGDPLRRA